MGVEVPNIHKVLYSGMVVSCPFTILDSRPHKHMLNLLSYGKIQ